MTTIVHVVNGEATAAPLAEAELPGEILVWADALDRGPVLPIGDAEHRAARAAYWAQDLGTDAASIDRDLAAADAAIDAIARTAEEIVLWYEHDLFDQLALIRILARLGRVPPTAPLTLVSIDRHPDVPDFQGFGQLEAYQLASLWPRRIPLAREALDEAAAAWLAVCAPDPRGVAFLTKRTRVLPFLAPALERFLEELPDVANGLTRTEAALVRAIDGGATSLTAMLRALHAGERMYYATDLTVWHALRALSAAGILAIDGALAAALASRPTKATAGLTGASVTARGKEILTGRLDRVATAGIDDWRGGVRLLGNGPVWRFDPASRRVVFA
ncbi:MAG: DUF1835 domain-containing protein [Deltaproteobacteria bacterium]|nr:DUF1835 domain-containing protein [Deltaproteobacteria bacterium]